MRTESSRITGCRRARRVSRGPTSIWMGALFVLTSLVVTPVVLSASISATGAARLGAIRPHSSATCASLRSQYPSVKGASYVVANDPSSPGYETINPQSSQHPGHVVGFDADLLGVISSCLGFHYSYLTESFGSLVSSLQAGRAQMVMSTLYDTPARAKVVNFVNYQYVVDGTLLRKGNPKHLTSLATTCGVTFAQETGSAEVQVIESQNTVCTHEGKKTNSTLQYSTQDEVFTAIQEGRADLTMTDVPVVTKVAKQFSSTLESGFSTRLPYTVAVAFQKSETKLLSAFRSALLLEQQNGTETKFLTKWTLAPSSLAPATIVR